MRGKNQGVSHKGTEQHACKARQLNPVRLVGKQNGQKWRGQGKHGRRCECHLPTKGGDAKEN
jgi:hypothetical protein